MKKYYFLVLVGLIQCSTYAMERKGKKRKTSYPLHEAIDLVLNRKGSGESMSNFARKVSEAKNRTLKRKKKTPFEMVAKLSHKFDKANKPVPAYVSTMYHKLLYFEVDNHGTLLGVQ